MWQLEWCNWNLFVTLKAVTKCVIAKARKKWDQLKQFYMFTHSIRLLCIKYVRNGLLNMISLGREVSISFSLFSSCQIIFEILLVWNFYRFCSVFRNVSTAIFDACTFDYNTKHTNKSFIRILCKYSFLKCTIFLQFRRQNWIPNENSKKTKQQPLAVNA